MGVFQKAREHILHTELGTDGTDPGTKGGETGRKMTKKVVFGGAVILAVVAVAAVVAVLLSGKGEDEVTVTEVTEDEVTVTEVTEVTEVTDVTEEDGVVSLPFPPHQTEPEVFMQTNNSFHGGVVIKDNDEFQKVVG